MILIGMFDSPFVRRVAVTMTLFDMPFQHRDWSVGKDFESIRAYNPLGRVPTLVLDDGESLIDSAAILDTLDELAGPDRALLPRSGSERRAALRTMAIAAGAAEKGVQQIYETAFRPEAKRHEPWVTRCRLQMDGALAELERLALDRNAGWLVADRMTQADVTVACVFKFLSEALGIDASLDRYPALRARSRQCEALPAFRAVSAEFHKPG
jgi:glutathione S-transferase